MICANNGESGLCRTMGKLGKAIKNENERFGRFGFGVKTCNFHVTWMLQTWSICVIFHLLNDGWMWLKTEWQTELKTLTDDSPGIFV
jgi:hypothetical protein